MAHVGKYVPWLLKNQVVIDASGPGAFYRPPSRKLHLNVTALGQTGTVAVLWSGQSGLSTIGDRWPDDETQTFYEWVNPSDSSLKIDFRFLFRIVPPTPTSSIRYEWDLHCRSWDSSGIIAEDDSIWLFHQPFVRPTPVVQIGPNWTDEYDIAKQQNLRVFLRAAMWSEQPDYHPYRYEP